MILKYLTFYNRQQGNFQNNEEKLSADADYTTMELINIYFQQHKKENQKSRTVTSKRNTTRNYSNQARY